MSSPSHEPATLLVAAFDALADVEDLVADHAEKRVDHLRAMPADQRVKAVEDLLAQAGIESMVLEAALAGLQAAEALAELEGNVGLAQDLGALRALADKVNSRHFGAGRSLEVLALAREVGEREGPGGFDRIVSAAQDAERDGHDPVEAARKAARWELLWPGQQRGARAQHRVRSPRLAVA